MLFSQAAFDSLGLAIRRAIAKYGSTAKDSKSAHAEKEKKKQSTNKRSSSDTLADEIATVRTAVLKHYSSADRAYQAFAKAGVLGKKGTKKLLKAMKLDQISSEAKKMIRKQAASRDKFVAFIDDSKQASKEARHLASLPADCPQVCDVCAFHANKNIS